MPTYSITYEYNGGKVTEWLEAPTIEAAREAARGLYRGLPRKIKTIRLKIKTIRLLEDRSEWREIWWKALNNMPSRVHHNPNEKWVIVPPNQTPIGDFIKKQAHGSMKQVDGVLLKRIVTRRTVRYQQLASLSAILHYALSGQGHRAFYGKGTMKQYRTASWTSVTNGLAFGTKPKGERGELLKKLAGPGGAALAIELLNK